MKIVVQIIYNNTLSKSRWASGVVSAESQCICRKVIIMADSYRDNRFATNFSPLGLSMAIMMPVFQQQDDTDIDEQPQKVPVGYASSTEKSNQ